MIFLLSSYVVIKCDKRKGSAEDKSSQVSCNVLHLEQNEIVPRAPLSSCIIKTLPAALADTVYTHYAGGGGRSQYVSNNLSFPPDRVQKNGHAGISQHTPCMKRKQLGQNKLANQIKQRTNGCSDNALSTAGLLRK